MCGIVGYLSKHCYLSYDIILESLKMIQNRGYDSAGICVINQNQLVNRKYASDSNQTALDLLSSGQIQSRIGIGHTRWATHGAKTDLNAHPHLDQDEIFAVVHNGIIENYMELKNMLIENNYKFISNTDTEVIANLISYHYKQTHKVHLSIQKAIDQLHGTWALVILSPLTPETIYLCKNGSPLLLGCGEDEIMIVSETSAFCQRFKTYYTLNDHDILAIDSHHLNHNSFTKYQVNHLSNESENLSLSQYKHWMSKEIYEQPEAIQRALNFGGRIKSHNEVKLGGFENNDKLKNIDNLVILACGTSLYAGLYGSIWIKKISKMNSVTVIDASEFTLSDLPKDNVGIIVISQSGETKDLHRCIEMIKNYREIPLYTFGGIKMLRKLPIIGVVNVVDSLIARESDCGVYLNAGREISVASTKSFTSQCIILVLISLWFAQLHKNQINILPGASNQPDLLTNDIRQKLIGGLNLLSHDAKLILDNYDSNCHDIAKLLKNKSSCFILGREKLYPIALEGALKFKEIGYIHAEGYCGGALKHGPFALIGPDTPVIILSDSETKNKMNSAIEEIKSRLAPVILISNHSYRGCPIDIHLQLNTDNYLSSLLYVMILQLISYKLAILKGHNPDFPKNLAKVVTVDG